MLEFYWFFSRSNFKLFAPFWYDNVFDKQWERVRGTSLPPGKVDTLVRYPIQRTDSLVVDYNTDFETHSILSKLFVLKFYHSYCRRLCESTNLRSCWDTCFHFTLTVLCSCNVCTHFFSKLKRTLLSIFLHIKAYGLTLNKMREENCANTAH